MLEGAAMISFLRLIFKQDAYGALALTGLIYLIAASREAAFSEYYDYPFDFVEISINNIIVSFVISFCIFYGFIRFPISKILNYKIEKGVSIFKMTLVMTGMLILVLCVFTISSGYEVNVQISILFLFLIVFLLLISFIGRKGKLYSLFFGKDFILYSERERLKVGEILDYDKKIYILLVGLCSFLLLMYSIFQCEARVQERFDVYTIDSSEFAIIRIYGEKVIVSPVKDGSIVKGARYVKLDSLNDVQVHGAWLRRDDVVYKKFTFKGLLYSIRDKMIDSSLR
ncbi:hypothetical protein WKH58_09875 [Pantoea agglomerans]